jgi:hypothetical protein
VWVIEKLPIEAQVEVPAVDVERVIVPEALVPVSCREIRRSGEERA